MSLHCYFWHRFILFPLQFQTSIFYLSLPFISDTLSFLIMSPLPRHSLLISPLPFSLFTYISPSLPYPSTYIDIYISLPTILLTYISPSLLIDLPLLVSALQFSLLIYRPRSPLLFSLLIYLPLSLYFSPTLLLTYISPFLTLSPYHIPSLF